MWVSTCWPDFKARYGCAVGLSDHSATIYPALAAVMVEAQVVEVHVTLSRDMFGPDVIASLTPEELRQTGRQIRTPRPDRTVAAASAHSENNTTLKMYTSTKTSTTYGDGHAAQRIADVLTTVNPGLEKPIIY